MSAVRAAGRVVDVAATLTLALTFIAAAVPVAATRAIVDGLRGLR